MSLEVIIFYLLLIDAVIANFVAFFAKEWFFRNFISFAKFFPLTKGWAIFYLIMVLWVGSLLFRM